MILNNIILMILGGGLTLGLYTSIQLLQRKDALNIEFRYLSFLLILCTINFVHPFLSTISGNRQYFSRIAFLEPSQFLLVPFIWIYIRNHLRVRYDFRFTDLFHLVPGLLVIILISRPIVLKWETAHKLPYTTLILMGMLMIQSFFYLFKSFSELKKSRQKLSHELSSFKRLDIPWIQSIFIIFIIIYGLIFILFLTIVHHHDPLPLKAVISFAFLAAILFISNRAMCKKELLPRVKIEKNATFTIKNADSLEESLSQLMNRDKVYLNPELTLNDLAEQLSCSRNEISWVLNNRIKKNFYQYINEFRVEEIINLMKAPEKEHYKILALAFDAGFNSKPAFNSIFRKVTGQTPSEYRKKLKKRS